VQVTMTRTAASVANRIRRMNLSLLQAGAQ
jgi:hypothetical protein